jgi:hypothetical protein
VSAFVDGVIAVAMGDRRFQDLSLGGGVCEWGVGLLDADMHGTTDEPETRVSHQGARKETGFAEDLKAVANPKDQATFIRELRHGLHHWGKARDRASAQIVSISESAGQNDYIAACQVFGLMPDELNGLPKNVTDSIKGVMIAIGPGKDHYSEFHAVVTPCGIGEHLF